MLQSSTHKATLPSFAKRLATRKFLSSRSVAALAAAAVFVSLVALANVSWSATIAHWRFEPGNLTADSSGNGHVLSNVGVTSSVDISSFAQGAGSADFDGSHTTFSTTSSLDLSAETQLTIEWFAKSPQNSISLIFEHSPDQNSNPGAFTGQLLPAYGPSDSVGFTNPIGAGSYRDATPTISGGLNNWHHYAVLIDRTTNNTGPNDRIRMYLDGVFVSTDIDSGVPTLTTVPFLDDTLFIGSRNNTASKYVGLLDELRISSGLLDSSEFLNVPPVVPEPSSLLLLTLGSLALVRRARRGQMKR